MSSSKHIHVEDILLFPEPPWNAIPRVEDDTRCRVLEEFGLDPTRPVIVVGHQPVFWHAGILAKFIAADALARSCNGQLVHLVIDGHMGSFNEVHWPVPAADGSLHRETWRFRDQVEGLPMAMQPACVPFEVPSGSPRGLGLIHAALDEAVSSGDAALQQSAALDRLMDPWVGPRTTITASALASSRVGVELAERMSSDPHACRNTYNRSLLDSPDVDIGELAEGELPSWTMLDDGTIRTSHDDDDPALRRFPKAMYLTAMARLGLGDFFVHGTGGARYDRCMETWIRNWIEVDPCPASIASATMIMDPATLLKHQALRQDLISSARRRKHDPALRAGTGPSTGKTPLLAEVDSQPPGSSQRREAYRRMHDALDATPGSGDGHLLPEETNRLLENLSVASDRTYPFAMHDPTALDSLAALIQHRLA